LQQYATKDYINLNYNENKQYRTNVFESVNTFNNDFFFSTVSEIVKVFTFEDGTSVTYPINFGIYPYY